MSKMTSYMEYLEPADFEDREENCEQEKQQYFESFVNGVNNTQEDREEFTDQQENEPNYDADHWETTSERAEREFDEEFAAEDIREFIESELSKPMPVLAPATEEEIQQAYQEFSAMCRYERAMEQKANDAKREEEERIAIAQQEREQELHAYLSMTGKTFVGTFEEQYTQMTSEKMAQYAIYAKQKAEEDAKAGAIARAKNDILISEAAHRAEQSARSISFYGGKAHRRDEQSHKAKARLQGMKTAPKQFKVIKVEETAEPKIVIPVVVIETKQPEDDWLGKLLAEQEEDAQAEHIPTAAEKKAVAQSRKRARREQRKQESGKKCIPLPIDETPVFEKVSVVEPIVEQPIPMMIATTPLEPKIKNEWLIMGKPKFKKTKKIEPANIELAFKGLIEQHKEQKMSKQDTAREKGFETLANKDKLTEKLTCTRMCRSVIECTKCPHGSHCRFAHSLAELAHRECAFGQSCKFAVQMSEGVYKNRPSPHSGKLCNCWHPGETDASYAIRLGIKMEITKPLISRPINPVPTERKTWNKPQVPIKPVRKSRWDQAPVNELVFRVPKTQVRQTIQMALERGLQNFRVEVAK